MLAAFVCYCSRSVYLHSPALCQNSNFLNYFRLCLCFRGDYITSSLFENSRQFHCEISTSYKCVIPSTPLLHSLLYLIIYHLRFFCHNLKRCNLLQYALEMHSLNCWEDNPSTSLGTQLWYFCTVHCAQEPDNWLLSKERKKKKGFHQHSLKAHCKNQRCSVQSGWSQGGLCLLSLLFYCPGPPIDAGPNHKKGKNRVVSSMPKRLRQLSFFFRSVFDALAWLQQMHKDLWLSLK